MAQAVRRDPARDRRLPDPEAQPSPDVGGMEAPAALREQQRRLAVCDQGRAATLEVAADRPLRRLTDRDEPGPPSLSLDPNPLALPVHALDFHVDELLRA